MSQIYDNNQFQELFGFNTASTEISTDSLDIINSLKLEYVDANKNIVSDANKKLVSEDKDSFVNTTNQITWSQVGRQFTATLPQQIATTSDVEFKSVEVSDKVLLTGGAFNWDIRNDTALYFRLNNTQDNFAMDTNFYPVFKSSQK